VFAWEDRRVQKRKTRKREDRGTRKGAVRRGGKKQVHEYLELEGPHASFVVRESIIGKVIPFAER